MYYAGHQECQQAAKSVGRLAGEKKIHHCPVMQGLYKLQSEEFFCSGSSIVMRLVGQQAGQPENQYAGHQEGQQAAVKSVGRQAGEKQIHHYPVMQGLCKLQSEEFLLRPA